MKKIICCLLIAVVLLTTGCNKKKEDVDLTKLSSTLVYAQLEMILTEHKDYVGCKVRIRGEYDANTVNGKTYHMVLIADSTNCCELPLEFELKEGTYPKEGRTVVVEGTFDTYKEGDTTYCTLRNAVLIPE